MKIYVAGPLGFSEAGRAFHAERVLAQIAQLGHVALDPWALTDPVRIAAAAAMPYGVARRDAWRALNRDIGGANAAAIRDCDLVFAVLDGSDVDSGTAAEIGYAVALGKPILGYRSDFRLSGDNEGARVNLQVEYFIAESGGAIIDKVAELGAALANIRSASPALRDRR
jgi:nucleoside 2-deoxyribosyltransferase